MRCVEHGGDIYGNPGILLDASVNTNPLGMPPEVRQALLSRMEEWGLYPDAECRALRAAIAEKEGVPADWILCGNGAADLIYRLCYALRPRTALVCAPGFSEYERALKQVDARVSHHTLKAEEGFALTEEIERKIVPGLDLLFLCNPNNPTGRLIPEALLARILKRARGTGTVVVIDECFLGFAGEGLSCKRHLRAMPALVILAAMTKMYALAGLRLGYLLCSNPKLLQKTKDAAQSWSVSTPAQIAGAAALSSAGWEENTRALIARERAFLMERLQELGAEVFPSEANYILFRAKKPLYAPLLEAGILIRSCVNFRGLDASYERIAVKTRDDNLRLIGAMKEILHGKNDDDSRDHVLCRQEPADLRTLPALPAGRPARGPV